MSFWIRYIRKRLSRITLIVIAGILDLGARLVPYRIAVAAGGAIGFISYYLLPRERKRALSNLHRVFPDRSEQWVRTTALRTFVHLGKSLLEVLAINPRRVRSVVTCKGLENLETAVKQGKGVVYVTAHIGNWELMAGAVSQKYPVSGVAVAIEPEPLNDLLLRLRAKMGIRTIVRNRPGAAKELIRVFRENRALGILMDQDTDVESVFVDFMGRPAWTPTGAAQMAVKFKAPVVFGYIRREKDDHHTVFIEGPLELVRTGNDEEDIRTNTAMFTKMIENAILRNPEQWVWMHRRWRRQP